MIICLDLYESRADKIRTEYSKAEVENYEALKVSSSIWTSRRVFSRDACRASNVLAIMLSKVRSPNIPSAFANALHETSSGSRISMEGEEALDSAIENSSGDTTTFDIPGQDFPMDFNSMDLNLADPLTTMFEFDIIDWVSLESLILVSVPH